MLLLAATSEVPQQLASRLRQLNELIFQALDKPDRIIELHPGESLHTAMPAQKWAWLRNGDVRGLLQEEAVVQMERGDLLGLTGGYGLPDLAYVAQSHAEVALYSIDQVLHYVHETRERAAQWTAFLLTQLSLCQQGLLSDPVRGHNSTGFLEFAAGETIIREGDPAGEVYHMVQGHADVYRNGVVVGEVPPGELFGAMAMLCGTPRTATVVAREDALVAAVPQADFQALIQRHPETAVILMENMSRTINDLNVRMQGRAENASAQPQSDMDPDRHAL